MAISFIGLAAAAANSVALPSFEAGDLALVFAFRDGSVTPPSLPAGWTGLDTGTIGTASKRTGYRVLQGGDTGTSAWTDATEIQVMVLRGQNTSSPVGNVGGDNTNNSNLIDYPGITLVDTGGTSWIAGLAGHQNATNVNLGTVSDASDPMTLRSGSIGSLGAHTKENTASFLGPSWDGVVNSASGAWLSSSIEVRADLTGVPIFYVGA